MMNDQQPAQASTKEDRLAFAAYLTAMLGDGEQLPNRTQLHKAAYLLEGIAKVQHGFPFALYLHGPYSYELDAALSELSAIGWLRADHDASGFGARYSLTERAREQLPRYEARWRRYGPVMGAIGKEVLPRGVADLELLATAWYVIQELPEAPSDARVQRLRALKPHFSEERVRQGLDDVSKLAERVRAVSALTTS
jgi:uncharacterized protein YwgA